MMLDYHALTMNEPRDSPARKQQFLVICTVILVSTIYSVVTSGVLLSVNISKGSFPGGVFVYKNTQRDYAASLSLLEGIAREANVSYQNSSNIMYTVYFDDPAVIKGRDQRFAAGYLAAPKNSSQKEVAGRLLKLNNERPSATKAQIQDLGAVDLWPLLKYQSADLPAVEAFVSTFPYTYGFASALVVGFKVLPALREYAAQHLGKNENLLIYSTCSRLEQTCTYYVPIKKTDKFLLGQMEPSKYEKLVGESTMFGFDYNRIQNTVTKYVPYLKRFTSKRDEL